MYKCNDDILETTIRIDLKRWKILQLSLFEKISTIKMSILPRFLFLFQIFQFIYTLIDSKSTIVFLENVSGMKRNQEKNLRF